MERAQWSEDARSEARFEGVHELIEHEGGTDADEGGADIVPRAAAIGRGGAVRVDATRPCAALDLGRDPIAGVVVAAVEVFLAKVRLFKVPELLAASFVMAFLAVTASYLVI